MTNITRLKGQTMNPYHVFRQVGAAALCAIALGCASNNLRVETSPSNTTLTVWADSDSTLSRHVETPTVIGLPGNAKRSVHTFRFEAEGFKPLRESLGPGGYQQLEKGADGTPILRIRLEEQDFEESDQIVIVYDAKEEEYVGVKKTERAYFKEDIERTTGAVASVLTLDGALRIAGFCLSPDGKQIFYSIAETENPDEQNSPVKSANLHAVRIGSGGVAQITDDQHINMMPFSDTRGEHLYFTSNRFGDDYSIVRKPAAGRRGGITDVYRDPRNGRCAQPSVGPDGTLLFEVTPSGSSNLDSRLWKLGGPDAYPVQLSEGRQAQINPAGDKIVFIGRDGNIWTSSLNGTNRTQLTSGAEEVIDAMELESGLERDLVSEVYPAYSHPFWSPSGRHILYTGRQGRDNSGRFNEDIWLMHADGGGRVQLTTNGSSDHRPLISPDGRYIYFLSNRFGHWAVLRLEAPQEVSKW